MGIIETIKESAKSVGITAIITDSDNKLSTQLNRNTSSEHLPIMLISWDMTTSVSFDTNGFITNPETPITALLMGKSETDLKETKELKADEMKDLFFTFIQDLYVRLIPFNRDQSSPVISGASAQLVPSYGMGKHSGCICRWTMKTQISNC